MEIYLEVEFVSKNYTQMRFNKLHFNECDLGLPNLIIFAITN